MQMNTATAGAHRQPPQLWRAQGRPPASFALRAGRLAHARVSAPASRSTTRGQSPRGKGATRTVRSPAATNAHPFRQPAFLPNLHSELAASCAVRFPNADKIRLSLQRSHADVFRPALILRPDPLNPSRNLFRHRRRLPESANLAPFRRPP